MVGEPADCTICSTSDGNLAVGGATYTQVYVDCQTGNNAHAGTRAAPKKTITSALTVTPNTGASLAVCFKGTCSASTGETFPLTPRAGLSGSYTRTVSSSDPAPFSFPTKPSMLIGWDANGDGNYPPHSGETAVLDGSVGSQHLAISNTAGVSYLEYAHFAAQDFGLVATSDDGFFYFASGSGGTITTLYVHDLQLTRILKRRLRVSNAIVFPFWRSGNSLNNTAVINVNVIEHGGYLARGEGGTAGLASSNWRFQNVSTTGYGDTTQQSTSAVGEVKLWGYITGVDILDSHFDANPSAWNAATSGGVEPTFAVFPCQCSQNWTIRNNDMIDYSTSINFIADSGFCSARPVDTILIDQNNITVNYAWLYSQQIVIPDGGSTTSTIGTVTMTNNFVAQRRVAKTNQALFWSNAGNSTGTQPGTITIAGNTFSGDVDAPAVIIGAYFNGYSLPAHPQQNYVFKDNVIASLGSGDRNIWVGYAPTNFVADYNVFQNDASGARFVWNKGSATTFANWKTQSSGDAHSSANCTPSFVSSSDLNLQAGDTCAKDKGTALTGLTSVDHDGGTRPMGVGWDVGADEYGPPALSPTLIQVVPVPGP